MAYKKKLIEVALPLEDINREAAREKSIRHGHPSTLHLWWARRPLAACRAVLFASLVDDPSECIAELMKDSAKRKAAEKVFTAQKKAWEARKAVFDRATKAGMTGAGNPPPGPELTLEGIIVETERERLFDIIRELVKWENSNNERVLNKARAEIMRSCNGSPPPVYDPFCGGGSIPLEAQRLGLEAHASDLNPVPVLITKALIEIPPRFAGKPPVHPLTTDYADNTDAEKKSSVKSVSSVVNQTGSWKGAAGLAEDIRYYGQWIRDEAEKRIGHLYPKVLAVQNRDGSWRHATDEEKLQPSAFSPQPLTVIAWLWARTVASPNPAAKGAHVPLVKSFWLSTKAGKKAWIEPVVDQTTMTYRFQVRAESGEPRGGTVSRNGAVCLLTGSPVPLEYVRAEGKARRLGVRMMAIVAEGREGRIYLPPDGEHEQIAQSTKPTEAPNTELPKQALGFRVQAYGMTEHKHLFTDRQLTLLITLCDLLNGARSQVAADSAGDTGYADAVTTYLGIAISKLAAFHCGLGMWRASDNKTGRAFGRQAISMVWDFPEANPFADAGGELAGTFESLGDLIGSLPASPQSYSVQHDAAVAFQIRAAAISTDPPYYDNVPYADLSDFFYIWLRRALNSVYPDLFNTVLVPKIEELIAEPFRHGSKEAAQRFFEEGIGKAFDNVRAVSLPEFPVTVYYAFKQTEEDEEGETKESGTASTGWETMLEGLVAARFSINGTWPMRTEQAKALKGTRNALASSIVLVCRPRPKDAGVASRRDFLSALKRELPDALRNLQKGNIAPVDLAQAAIGPGMAVFSRYARVIETDGSPMSVRTALALINQSLDEVLAEQEGEFDTDTRWALAWFDQYGFTEGAYGVAETLSTAKNTSVSGMVEAGILAAKGGKVRLLKKEELTADWNPATDKRLTVWEITHHLIRRLEQGESGAAELIQKLGPIAETARDLSYRLYTICERRKWAQEAIAYNTLVLSWGDVKRLAEETKAAVPTQGEMQL